MRLLRAREALERGGRLLDALPSNEDDATAFRDAVPYVLAQLDVVTTIIDQDSRGHRTPAFAATWSKRFDLNNTVQEIATALAPKNYGEIKGTTVLKCLAAVRDDSTSRERILALRQLRDRPSDMDGLVARTKKALLQAVDQLVTDFRLYSLDFLPYEAHLVILTHIYANNRSLTGPQLRRVRQWFWRTSFSERYRGAPDDFVTRDLAAIQKFVLDGQSEAEALGPIPDQQTIKSMIFRKNNSRSRAFVLALAKQGPRNITNGAAIDTADALSVYNKKQFHHISPTFPMRLMVSVREQTRSSHPTCCQLQVNTITARPSWKTLLIPECR